METEVEVKEFVLDPSELRVAIRDYIRRTDAAGVSHLSGDLLEISVEKQEAYGPHLRLRFQEADHDD